MLRNKYISITAFFFICLVVSSLSSAQTPEYKDYIVVKGDTLWDISDNELKDPFLWPKVWKENPEIRNPDLIYPGQKIRIPLYLLQKEIKPVVTPEIKPAVKPDVRIEPKPAPAPPKPVQQTVKPAPRKYLVNKHVLTASGYIADSLPDVGLILDTPSGKTILGKGDYAYIKVKKQVQKGDKFYILVPTEKIKHPVSGNMVGYLIEIRGVVEVVEQEENDDPRVIVTTAYLDVSTGNLLDNYYEIEPELVPQPPRKPDVHGYVVASKHLHLVSVPYDIAYIDKGTKDGLQVGDMLATTLQSPHMIYNAIIQVINAREKTSTVIIRKSTDAVTKGDGVTKVKQE